MHLGKSYKLKDFLFWTRRNIYRHIIVAFIATILYQVIGSHSIIVPWPIVAMIGTATAFTIGFKNVQTYNINLDASQVWASIQNISRNWGIMCRDYLDDPLKARELMFRHFAWLTALRYQMRSSTVWETAEKAHNSEYQRRFSIPEREVVFEKELDKYISLEEIKKVLPAHNAATQLLAHQSKELKTMMTDGEIENWRFVEMEKVIFSFFDLQGKSERIKNSPYPRQYSTINSFFVTLFCLLLPFGLLQEFDKLNDGMTGLLQGKMVWLVIPFSVLISWVYSSLEQVGESTENPFEGSANDVPVSFISRNIEIELREMIGETGLSAILPKNDIVL